MKKAHEEEIVRQRRANMSSSSLDHCNHDRSSRDRRRMSSPRQKFAERPSVVESREAEHQDNLAEEIQPQPSDVLCGKDKACLVHPGNKRYRQLIDQYQPRYSVASNKHEKMAITKEIVHTLSRTARFLKYNTATQSYEELSHLEARDKTSHALRTACKRVKNEQTRYSTTATALVLPNISTSPIRQQSAPRMAHPLPYHPQPRPRPQYDPYSRPSYQALEHQFQPLSLHEDSGRMDDGAMFGDLLSWLKDPLPREGSE